ncbi:hypothetical protein CSKR_109423 [Clonorchis sinensis]|uniref:Uncharacterized protein n=1 Tax=Clonorchis sinensis TaxID=79923 RepID=A0A419PZ12_CLOSI|nr:hypothetical protein CSKR_109423 [Clonorchis sinensis]
MFIRATDCDIMHLYVVTILGGLVCSQVLGNPQMKPFQKSETGLHGEKIVHKSNESSVNEQTASPAAVKKNTQKDQAMPENVVAVVGSSANSSAHSPEQTASSTPDSNGDDLQTSSTPNSREQIQHAGRWWPDVDVILECPCDDSDAEPQTKCPCSYAKQVGINQSELDSTHVSLGSTEPSANKQTDPLTLANDTLTQEDQTNTENADFTEMLCANLTDSSLENHESATPNTNEPDLQTPITRTSRNVTAHAGECKPKFEVLGKPTKPEFPSNHPDVEQPAECPCTYDKLKVMRRTLRNAEYVLEDVMLHLKRTRKLEKIVSDLLNSMDRTLRGNTWPM